MGTAEAKKALIRDNLYNKLVLLCFVILGNIAPEFDRICLSTLVDIPKSMLVANEEAYHLNNRDLEYNSKCSVSCHLD